MKLGERVTFHALDRQWTLEPFSLGIWFGFVDWCKANLEDDPLARVSRLPLDKMSREAADEIVKQAIAEDKEKNDYRPESEATVARLGTPRGMCQAVFLLAGGKQGKVTELECDTLVSSFVMNGQADVLVSYLTRCMGISDKLPEKNG